MTKRSTFIAIAGLGSVALNLALLKEKTKDSAVKRLYLDALEWERKQRERLQCNEPGIVYRISLEGKRGRERGA